MCLTDAGVLTLLMTTEAVEILILSQYYFIFSVYEILI